MVGVGGVVCRKWSGNWCGLEKVVGVVGVNWVVWRKWLGLLGLFVYGGVGGLENRCFLCIEIMTLYNLRMHKIFHPFR